MELTEYEIRVLGALIEKEATTPDYYPLSLNALKNACNQKSNRNPVLNLTEEDVKFVLHSLNEQKLVIYCSGQGQRVMKYKHNLPEICNLSKPENALIAILFLRGRQTAGELRQRTQRIYNFNTIEDVHACLKELSSRDVPLVKLLPRLPGQIEQRYQHLLGEDIPEEEIKEEDIHLEPSTANIASLQKEMSSIRLELAEMRKEFNELKNSLGIEAD